MSCPIAGHTNSLEQFSDAYRDGKVIFFAGLPKAPDILDHSLRAALPTLHLTQDERKKITSDIQPEVFYETLLCVDDTMNVLGLWRSLHLETQTKYGIQCPPNNVHWALVKYSAKHGIPILTTNFDTMFEAAAKNHTLHPLVFLPKDDPPAQHYTGKPVICKLHGSISDSQGNLTLDSLMTTMTQISKINKPWLGYISKFVEDRSLHICFVGYSGRDVDLFPHIRTQCLTRTTKPLWLNHFEDDCYSDEASRQCCAIRIDSYPSEVLNKLGAPCAQQPPQILGICLLH